MESFKLRVVLGDVQIELEGNESMVQSIFSQICDNGLGVLKSCMKLNNHTTIESNYGEETILEADTEQYVDANTPSAIGYPSLANVVLKGELKTEAEWILIYSFYCSAFGAKLFTEDDLRSKYDESKRFNDTRRKNFKTNIKSLAAKKLISAVNATEYRIEKEGIEKAKSILFVEQSTKKITSKNKKSTPKKQTPKYEMKQLEITDSETKNLREFWTSHDHSSHMDKAVLAAFWLKEKKALTSISADHVFTILRTLSEAASFDLLSSLKNAKNKKKFFQCRIRG